MTGPDPDAALSSLTAGAPSPVVGGRLQRSLHSGRVTADLAERIVAGELPAGTPLVETVLAERLGVSRGPIRNALLQLEGEGLVRTKPNGRPEVAGFTQEDLVDLLAVRLELESLGVAWGVRAEHDTAPVTQAFDAMAREGASTPGLIQLDMTFHRALIEFSGSRSLLHAWLRLAPVIVAVITVGNRRLGDRHPHSDFNRILEAHRLVVEAVTARRPEEARRLLEEQFALTAAMYRVDGQPPEAT